MTSSHMAFAIPHLLSIRIAKCRPVLIAGG
nr:MAG TPA: hypothetical protein [Caudoviricetes sp.]